MPMMATASSSALPGAGLAVAGLPPGRYLAVSSARRFGELFEHDVHVQTADAERIDGRAARQAIGLLGPVGQLPRDIERRLVPVDLAD